MNECGIRPEHECFDSGHVAYLDPLLDMGVLHPPLQVSCVMGVTGGIRPTARNLAHMAEQVPDVPHEWGVIGISREQWTLVAAALSLGRQRARRPGGQLLPARRRDGALQRRPDRAGAADGRGRRPARGDGGRGAAAARACASGRRWRERGARGPEGPRPVAAAAGRVLLAAAGRLRRRRDQGRGHRDGRLRALGAAVLRGRRQDAPPRRCSSRSTAASARSAST